MNQRQIRKEANFRAGLILESLLGDWEPEDLMRKYGQETVEKIRDEMNVIATRLTSRG